MLPSAIYSAACTRTGVQHVHACIACVRVIWLMRERHFWERERERESSNTRACTRYT